MCYTVPAAVSPLNCRWIKPGSRHDLEGFEYAVCRRLADAERVVNEADCLYCPSWQAARPVQSSARRPDPSSVN